ANTVINPSRRRYYHAAELGPKVGRAAVKRRKQRLAHRSGLMESTPRNSRPCKGSLIRLLCAPFVTRLVVCWQCNRSAGPVVVSAISSPHHGVSMTVKNAFYAQSGGVTAVINASAAGVIETARQHPDRIGKVYAG